jgi:hypothetical protein
MLAIKIVGFSRRVWRAPTVRAICTPIPLRDSLVSTTYRFRKSTFLRRVLFWDLPRSSRKDCLHLLRDNTKNPAFGQGLHVAGQLLFADWQWTDSGCPVLGIQI